MRVIALLFLAAAACETRPPLPDARVRAPDAMARVIPPPELPPVEGASAGSGVQIFAETCARCHGPDGKGGGPDALKAARGPTDLTRRGYLCRSTGENAPPADVDLDAALGRGSHAGLAPLDAAARRSVVLHVKSLGAFEAAPVLDVPPRPPADAAARARGRTLYLAFGCWLCHGPNAAGDGTAVKSLAWGGRTYTTLPPLADRAAYVCGDAPDRIYRTLAIGMGVQPQIMPPYLDLAERIVRPANIDAPDWQSKLTGKVPPEEVTAVRDFLRAIPPTAEVRRLDPDARRARGARHLWDLVAYLESL